MKANSILILSGGVLSLVLAGTAAAPCTAQTWHHQPQYSTPAERAQTQQLNSDAINGTAQSPAELNGQGGEGFYGGEPGYQQNRYDDAMQRYNNAQQDYQLRRARYEDEMRAYRMRWRDYGRSDYDYPNPY